MKRRNHFFWPALLAGLLLVLLGGYHVLKNDKQEHSKRPITLKNKIPSTSLSSSHDSTIEYSTHSTKQDLPKKTTAYELWNYVTSTDKTDPTRFYKVGAQGQVLLDDDGYWDCVYDSITGLLWEVKTNDGGWKDHSHTYSWYEPPERDASDSSEIIHRPEYGKADGGQCYDIACDTSSYRKAVNEEELCGVSEWRLPYAHELGFLDHDENYYPDIDTRYFPNTAGDHYWSRTETPSMVTLAWSVNFYNGFPYTSEKHLSYRVRLVSDALRID